MTRTERTAANATLAWEFLDLLLNQRNLTAAGRLMADDFAHHEPRIEAGADGLLTHLAEVFEAVPDMNLELVRQVWDGDFVVTHSRRSAGGQPDTAVVDILRVEDGRIAEYWHVFQAVPETLANPNGMF